jgi:hypothetical protein
MDSTFTHYGQNSSGESIYKDTDEISMVVFSYVFEKWINKMKLKNINFTIDDYHNLFELDKDSFEFLKKNISWSDSFMIDTKYFKTGGGKRFIDYPEIKKPYLGQMITIDGKEQAIVNYGVLTFDTTFYDSDSDDDEQQQEEQQE